MVKTYQKKPVTVHARMYDGENGLEIKTFAGASAVEKDGVLYIQSKEGVRAAKPGDYIVRGVDCEFFASSPESFEKNNVRVSGDEYQKKPVTVTAVQYDGENFKEIQQFTSFDPSRTAPDASRTPATQGITSPATAGACTRLTRTSSRRVTRRRKGNAKD